MLLAMGLGTRCGRVGLGTRPSYDHVARLMARRGGEGGYIPPP